MNFFFYLVFKAISYQRADVRGTRATGEKRRIAWPEMLTVLFPLFWAINIITNALAFLRILEGNSGYVLLSVQVAGFQWGWKYCYHDTFYIKFHSNPIMVGENSAVSPNGGMELLPKRRPNYDRYVYVPDRNFVLHKVNLLSIPYFADKAASFGPIKKPLNNEIYFSRWWLKRAGVFISEKKNLIHNKFWQTGFWVTGQGLNPDDSVIEDTVTGKKINIDPLRLLRSSGALILPARSTVRLMACSEDVTHSWAVPGIGLKMDCVPGRLFCLYINISRDGVYFGQCSELCGWNHYNMPAVVYALPVEHFIVWWEIELHTMFNESLVIRERTTNYSLLSFKYK